jgi:DNA-binding NarL/FixJ family response regulator
LEGHRADATAAGLAARLVIAARLFISQVTVRIHVSAILRELHVSTREAAIELLER